MFSSAHTLRVDKLLLRHKPEVLRSGSVLTGVLAAVAAGLAARAFLRPGPLIGGWTILVAGCFLVMLAADVWRRRAFTECSTDGIRTNGPFGFGSQRCSWAEVDTIWEGEVGDSDTTVIRLTRRDGSYFDLDGVPDGSGPIIAYWREATAEGVPGRPAAVKDVPAKRSRARVAVRWVVGILLNLVLLWLVISLAAAGITAGPDELPPLTYALCAFFFSIIPAVSVVRLVRRVRKRRAKESAPPGVLPEIMD